MLDNECKQQYKKKNLKPWPEEEDALLNLYFEESLVHLNNQHDSAVKTSQGSNSKLNPEISISLIT